MIRFSLALRPDRLAAGRVFTHAALPLAGLAVLLTVADVAAAEAPRTIAPAPAARSMPVRKTIVDPAVAPAGGGCRQCGPAGCRHGHGGHGHHSACRDGHCVPYCPVRPGQFGFYDTRWRKWPGEGVVPASALQSATPAVPPKSSPPGVDEESFGPPREEVAPAAQGANRSSGQDVSPPRDPEPTPTVPAPQPVEPETAEPVVPEPQPEPAPVAEPEVEKAADVSQLKEPEPEPAVEVPVVEPAASEPVPEPAVEKPAAEKPAAEKSADDDLFDEAATGRVQRVFVAARPGEPRQVSSTSVQQVAHRQAAAQPTVAGRRAASPKHVPRVSFDPHAETERLSGKR